MAGLCSTTKKSGGNWSPLSPPASTAYAQIMKIVVLTVKTTSAQVPKTWDTNDDPQDYDHLIKLRYIKLMEPWSPLINVFSFRGIYSVHQVCLIKPVMNEKQFMMQWLQPWQGCIPWIGEILDYPILVLKEIIWEDRYITTKLLVIAS